MHGKAKSAKTEKDKEALDPELVEAVMKLNVAELPPLVLWIAIDQHFFFLAKYLIDSGIDIVVETEGLNPFWKAIYQYPNAAEIASHEGADKERVNWILASLLGRGADINAPNAEGQTPLQFAAEMELLPLMDFLMAHGADRTSVTELAKKGELPPYSAVKLIPINRIPVTSIPVFDTELHKVVDYDTREDDTKYITFFHEGKFTKYPREELKSRKEEQQVYVCSVPGSTKRSNVKTEHKMFEIPLITESVFIEANMFESALESNFVMFALSKLGIVTNIIREEEIDTNMNLNNTDSFNCQTGSYEVYSLIPIVYMPVAGGKRATTKRRKLRRRRRSVRQHRNRA